MTDDADRLALLAQTAVRSAVSRELGQHVEYHPSIGSTQDRARELAPGPAIVVADEQTAGRGTKERRWLAPPGSSVLVSFVVPGPPPAAPVASLVAGVAVARALESLGAHGGALKWPNDVLLGGRKVAGILTHASSGPGGYLIVGIGLNVSQTEADLAELRATATSLALAGVPVDRLAALATLAREIARAFEAPALAILDEWRGRSTVLGRRVLVARSGEDAARGVAVALEPDGALRVETAYGPVRILTGEVVVEEQFAIMVDGTAALPPELARELDLRVLPLHVSFGEQNFTAGVDLSPAEFYERLQQPNARPTTSQPSLGECTDAFEAARRDGAQGILAITVANELSGTYSALTTAKDQVAIPVEVVDSRATAGSIALIGTAAARARGQGKSFAETVKLARRLAGNVKLYAIIDTLEQLKRSGRASGMQAMFGSLLSIKPIIKIENGKLEPMDKVRTRDKALARLKELIEAEVAPGARLHVCVIHTNAADRAALVAEWLKRRYDCVEHYTAEAGPVIAAHGGPGVVGVCWYPESMLGS